MTKQSRLPLWLLAGAFNLLALAVFLIPMWIIQPFKAQDPDMLAYALTLKRFAPWLAALSVLASLTLARRLRRWPAYVLSVLTLVFAAGSFVNIFEIMFHPIDQPVFSAAADARMDDDDMLLAIKLGAAARAYPVRTLAYHHLINDTVNNVPVVATY